MKGVCVDENVLKTGGVLFSAFDTSGADSSGGGDERTIARSKRQIGRISADHRKR